MIDIRPGNSFPAGALSNFAQHFFVFRGVNIHSMEGLLQSLKFKEPDIQNHICTLTGFNAKKAGSTRNWQKTQILWWDGEPIDRECDDYQNLLDEAYSSLFSQNKKAREALIATGDVKLIHSIGRNRKSETVLAQEEFYSRLTNIRDILKH